MSNSSTASVSVADAFTKYLLALSSLKAELPNPLWNGNHSGLDGRELVRSQVSALNELENNWELRHFNATDCASDSYGDTLVYSVDGAALCSVCQELQKRNTTVLDLVNGVQLDGAFITLDLDAQIDEWSQQYDWSSDECDELRESLIDCESPILSDGGIG